MLLIVSQCVTEVMETLIERAVVELNLDCVVNSVTVCDRSDADIDAEGSGGAELRLCCEIQIEGLDLECYVDVFTVCDRHIGDIDAMGSGGAGP